MAGRPESTRFLYRKKPKPAAKPATLPAAAPRHEIRRLSRPASMGISMGPTKRPKSVTMISNSPLAAVPTSNTPIPTVMVPTSSVVRRPTTTSRFWPAFWSISRW